MYVRRAMEMYTWLVCAKNLEKRERKKMSEWEKNGM